MQSCCVLQIAQIVTSQMNHHVVWIKKQQGCKHVSRIRPLPCWLTEIMYRCIIQDKPKQISMCNIMEYSEGTWMSETYRMVFEAIVDGRVHSQYGTDGKLIDGV